MDDDLRDTLLAYAFIAAGGLVALLALTALAPRLWRKLLPLRRLRPVPWTGREVFLAFVLSQLIPMLVDWFAAALLAATGFYRAVLGQNPDVRFMATHADVIASPLSLVATLTAILRFLYVTTGTRPGHLGLTRARLPANLALGILVFLVLTPAVESLYALVIQYVPQSGEYPPVLLVQQGFPSWEWGFLIFSTVVAAPILEELLFRGLFQNWLRRTSLAGHALVMALTMLLAMITGYQHEEVPRAWYQLPQVFGGALVLIYAGLLVWLHRRYLPADGDLLSWNLPALSGPAPADGLPPAPAAGAAALEAPWRRWQRANALLAVWGSAMLFSLGHLAKWPTPVPLFVLGLGLGWLALRTQSLVGPILVHALFNAVTCVVLYGTPPVTNGKEQTVAERPAVVGSTSSSVPGAWQPRRR